MHLVVPQYGTGRRLNRPVVCSDGEIDITFGLVEGKVHTWNSSFVWCLGCIHYLPRFGCFLYPLKLDTVLLTVLGLAVGSGPSARSLTAYACSAGGASHKAALSLARSIVGDSCCRMARKR